MCVFFWTLQKNEAKLNTGLIQGVLYLLIDLAEIEVDGKRHRIVLLYNSTSGKHDSKWTGDWSERLTRHLLIKSIKYVCIVLIITELVFLDQVCLQS